MAVQFNLLPDVKLEFNRAQRAKRLVYGVSMLAAGTVLAIVVISFLIVNVLQRQLISSANNDIKTYSSKLKSIPDLEKVLTIQNQLKSLPSLHTGKHVTSRIYTFLPQVTPAKVFIGQVTLDADGGTMSINGTADSVASVNTFVDTLKFTNAVIGGDNNNKKPAFTNVVLSSIGRTEKNASYTIDTNFDSSLFDGSQNVTLDVPKEVTTRSVLNTPNIGTLLFNGDTGKNNNQQGGAQ
jgi:Tfp pilus assembly protein PilN